MPHLTTYISPLAKIGNNVKIGRNCIVQDNVQIGDNSIISDFCILGEPLNSSYSDPSYVNPILTIGESSLIRSHSLIYAGSQIGSHFQTGPRVTIRENMNIPSVPMKLETVPASCTFFGPANKRGLVSCKIVKWQRY